MPYHSDPISRAGTTIRREKFRAVVTCDCGRYSEHDSDYIATYMPPSTPVDGLLEILTAQCRRLTKGQCRAEIEFLPHDYGCSDEG